VARNGSGILRRGTELNNEESHCGGWSVSAPRFQVKQLTRHSHRLKAFLLEHAFVIGVLLLKCVSCLSKWSRL